jgi:preprotein translocase subunit Sec63
MSDSNHYDTLDVTPQATLAEIKQAYRRLAKRFHPDSKSETADPEKIIKSMPPMRYWVTLTAVNLTTNNYDTLSH